MATMTEHPSNRLAHGEARTFAEAIDLYCQAVRAEMRWDREHGGSAALPADMRDDWPRQLRIAGAALVAYDAAERAVRDTIADNVAAELAAQFPDREYEYVAIIAALRDGDYTRMAF